MSRAAHRLRRWPLALSEAAEIESAASNWVWDVAPASIFNQHLLYPAGLELVLALLGRLLEQEQALGQAEDRQVLGVEGGWCDVLYPIRGRSFHFRRLPGRHRPASVSFP